MVTEGEVPPVADALRRGPAFSPTPSPTPTPGVPGVVAVKPVAVGLGSVLGAGEGSGRCRGGKEDYIA